MSKAWLHQLVLGQVLIGHSPYRAVVELVRDLFDYPISLGTVHKIAQRREPRARDQRPVRSGRCPHRRPRRNFPSWQAGPRRCRHGLDYCYLLSLEEHRDAVTWGTRLLDLIDQGFDPEATVADAGSGLRAGQAQALPKVPCRGDVFHILRDLERLVSYIENRAYGALETSDHRERQRYRKQRHDGRGRAKSAQSAGQLLRQRAWSAMML